MPYRKTGFVTKPRSTYIPYYCKEILTSFGPKFDLTVAEIIKSLGRENINLKNFVFERCLTLKHAELDANTDLKFKFIIVLADYLHSIGYISTSPVFIDYVIDPVYTAEDLIVLMLGSRMPKFTAAELGGEWGTIDHLMMFFAEVIRRNAIILEERKFMVERFRAWMGSIGHKLLTRAGELSQSERSFLTIYSYCSTPGYKGYITDNPTKIPAVETKEPLTLEVGALAQATCLPGPCTSHMKLLSNGILEQLFYYYGPHVSDLKTFVGYKETYGPFDMYKMNPADSVPWALDSQLIGLTATAANFMVKPANMPPFSLRVPFARKITTTLGTMCLYPDDMQFRITLIDPTDISNYEWAYNSKWRGRWIHSSQDGGSMDYALADAAVNNRTAGNTQVELSDLSSVGLCTFTDAAKAKVIQVSEGITEEYVLPGDTDLEYVNVDMTAYYARFGDWMMLPAFSEFMELPQAWFMTPAEAVLDYVSTVEGLTIEERVRFSKIIEICHNCARYKRLTMTADLPFDRDDLILAMLNKPGVKITKAKE
jgi:hypothetical protein